jgi:hypothetical protein
MKLRDLLKRGPRVKPLPPIKTIQSPSLARKERLERERAADENAGLKDELRPPGPGLREPKKIDPIFEDTGSLELTAEPDDKGNPYDTQSWQMDPREGLRRVDNLKAVNREPEPGEKEDVANPYDTAIVRKGW